MEQKHFPKTTQHKSVIDQAGQNILSDLARKLGELFAVNSCVIVCDRDGLRSSQQIGWWQSKGSLGCLEVEQSPLFHQLLSLELEQNELILASCSGLVKSRLFNFLENLFQEFLPTQTWLGTTTKYQEKTNGLILLFKSESTKWTDSESELLKKISESMAIAIAQVQLQQQAQAKTRYQALLNHLSREISQSSNPDLLLNTCLAETCKTLEVDRGMILMLKYQDPLKAKRRPVQLVKGTVQIVCQWNHSGNSLDSVIKSPVPLRHQEGLAGDRLPRSFNIKDSNICQKAWHLAPQCLAINEGTSFPDLTREQLPDGIESNSSALLIMPLMGKKNSESQPALVLGFIVLQRDSSRVWLQDELDLINWVSVQISIATIHHQTLNQVQSIVEERTSKLKWSLDVHGKLSEKMRQHIDQLQKLNQLKDDFMNSMSHELKTPLTSMKMAIKMLRQQQISPDMREKYLNILEEEWEREYSLIKDLLTLQQVESGELTFSPQELDLNQTIAHLAQSFNAKWQPNKGLNLKTELSNPALKIFTDSESLEHILSELLLNAGKYSDADTIVELSVNSKTTFDGKEIVISLANYGAGISSEELPHIFDKFRRGKGVTDRAVPGTGLGLTLVKYLVDHLNGTIEVSSEPVDENSAMFMTTFLVKLPQFQPSIG